MKTVMQIRPPKHSVVVAISVPIIFLTIGRTLSTFPSMVSSNCNFEDENDTTRNGNFENEYDTKNDNRICQENPFLDSLSLPLSRYGELMDEWMSNKIPKEKDLMLELNHDHGRFNGFEVMGSCNQTCIGGTCRDDTSKIVCMGERIEGIFRNGEADSSPSSINNINSEQSPPCIVYSIGGNNNWAFELDTLEKTACEVHTFDCTGERSRFKKPESDRLHFHYVCLGTENKPAGEGRGEFWTLEKMQKTLKHPRIDLFKIDIEGWEWPLFDVWPMLSDKRSATAVLPMQIMVEVHYRSMLITGLVSKEGKDFKFPSDMINLQDKFLKMGYAVVVRDDNQFCKHCTELTLLRIRCPPQPSL